MRVAGIAEPGGDVRPLDVDEPRPPEPDEVLLDVRAAGVGNWDELVRVDAWDAGLVPPCALGVQVAGTVTAVGRAVAHLRPGDDVLGHVFPPRHGGTWAERLVAPAGLLAVRPPHLSWPVAGVLPVPGLTAWQALDALPAPAPGDPVLVQGAGGVTGSLLVQLAALRGLRVLAVAGAGSSGRLRRLGAEVVLDRADAGWPDAARALLPGAPGLALVAGGTAADAMRALPDGGRLVTITGAAPEPVRGITTTALVVRPDARAAARLAVLVADGRLRPPEVEEWPLDRAAEALRAVVAGRQGRAVALVP